MKRKLLGLMLMATFAAQAAPPTSEFIENLPPLVADTKNPGAMSYIASGASLKGFSKVAIDPVLVWYSDQSKYHGIDADELSLVTKGLHDALVSNLEPKYPVVRSGGDGMLHIRVAITNVMAEKKKKGLLGFTPVGLVVGAAKNLATAGPNIDLRSANIEVEVLDASGAQIAVIIEPLIGGTSRKDALTWAQIAEALDDYGKRLRSRLDADNP